MPSRLSPLADVVAGAVVSERCCDQLNGKSFKLINGVLPDFVIDARGARFSKLLQFTDSSRLDGVETLVDIKGLGSVSHRTTFFSAPNKDSSSPSTAGQLRCTRSTARPPRTSTASTNVLRMTRLARSNLPSCRSGLWLTSTRARFSGSVSAVSGGCLPNSMAFSRSTRTICGILHGLLLLFPTHTGVIRCIAPAGEHHNKEGL